MVTWGNGAGRGKPLCVLCALCGKKIGISGLESGSAAFSHLLENGRQGAEAREGRLQQVEADEGGEPHPVGVVVMGERQADQNNGAGEGHNDTVYIHDGVLGIRS